MYDMPRLSSPFKSVFPRVYDTGVTSLSCLKDDFPFCYEMGIGVERELLEMVRWSQANIEKKWLVDEKILLSGNNKILVTFYFMKDEDLATFKLRWL